MKPIHTLHAQRGAVLIVGLIVLMLITLMVTAAFKFSTYNLKSVGNMQSHNEAVAAANQAIEKVVGSWNFGTTPAGHHYDVDINNDGVYDYAVEVDAPTCVKAMPMRIAGSKGDDCSLQLNATTACTSALSAAAKFNVVWDIPATATAPDGTYVRVRQGISLSLTKAQCDTACPPSATTTCQ
ncbi:MAG: pilus assembly PilX N-terminal domain-containing protein [Pseudomonadota bacterium]